MPGLKTLSCLWICLSSWLLNLTSANGSPCFNLSFVRSGVLDSDLVFIGKILNLTELSSPAIDKNGKTGSRLFSESLVNPNESQQIHYYQYNHVNAMKRRRHSQDEPTSIKSYVATVQFKSVFKGHTKQQQKFEGRVIPLKIYVGNPKFSCLRRLRALDTRIFFYMNALNEDDSSDWQQILVPLPPTLAILSTVRQTTKDEPCSQIYCSHGSDCVVEHGRGVCRCPESCSSGYAPVCGSDDVTYANECLLKKFACKHQKSLHVKRAGECSDRPDPCLEKICPFGARCTTSANGAAAICECPPECPTQLDDMDLGNELCGSDGKIYRNECELNREACLRGHPLTVKFFGKCDPCESIECDGDGVCQLDNQRRPVCSCDEECDLSLNRPVCASNGRSYINDCFMRMDACRSRTELHIIYRGHCSSGVNPCDNVLCERHESCAINRFGVAQCTCAMVCEEIVRPVCGTDGKTYDNGCQLTLTACRESRDVTIAFFGSCGVCTDHKCNFHSTCIIDDGHPKCECQQNCKEHFDSEMICGSDGQLYTSECELQKASCLQQKSISIEPSNVCDLCWNVQCKFGALCVGGVCQCPTECPTKYEPVCGSNFQTFANECELQKAVCNTENSINVMFYGNCSENYSSKGTEIGDPFCKCNRVGSRSRTCDLLTKECECHPGIGGTSCDRCLPGFWGFPRKSSHAQRGCIACECSELGAVREDCEQMSGQCECKSGQTGQKCDSIVTSEGIEEPESRNMKSTRHLLPQLMNFHDNFAKYRQNTISTVEMKSYLGDSCQSSSECVTTFSVCLQGMCICKEGYYEDSERIQCKPTLTHAPKPLACIKSACHPSSSCLDHLNGTYSCICPLGKAEIACTQDEAPIPLFTGKSVVTLGKVASGTHKLSIEMQITPFLDNQHGILLFASQYANGTGDFMSLALIDGHVEFRYDLGDGPLKLRSANRLQSGTTYTIAAKRYNRDGLLQVNEDEEIQASSAGFERSLELGEVGYMGHVPLNSTLLWETVGTSQGFVGCVQAMHVGRRPVEFRAPATDPLINSLYQVSQCVQGSTAMWPSRTTTTPPYAFIDTSKQKVRHEEYSVQLLPAPPARDPCSKFPCKNNGHCWTDSSERKGFRCVCHPLYSGKICETKIETISEAGVMLDFRGSSYLQLPQVGNHSRQLSIELWVMPRSANGLLIYSGQFPGKGDFIALHLREGRIEFLYELGSGIGNLTWPTRIALNRWHWISVVRSGREARLQVDGGAPQMGKSPPTLSELNLELPLYLAGVPDIDILHRRLEIDEFNGFDGVFQFMRINGVTFHKQILWALNERQVHKYEGPPCGSSVSAPCLNGGSCFPRLTSFTCLCSAAFTGETCETRKMVPGPLRFNGDNFIRFPMKTQRRRKMQQRENRIEIVFRTTGDGSGVLFWMGQPPHEIKRRGYMGLFVSEGYLELRVNLGANRNKKAVVIRSKMLISDGRWHEVLIVRRRRLIVLEVDGVLPQRATAPVGSNLLHSDGRLWVGGVASGVIASEIPPKFHDGFRGCVDVVRVDKKRVPLAKIGYTIGAPVCADDD